MKDDAPHAVLTEAPVTTGVTPNDPTGTSHQGSYLRTRLTRTGVVVTDLQLSGTDLSALHLTVWSPPAGTGESAALAFRPRLDDLTVTADGQPVSSAPGRLRTGQVVDIPLPHPAAEVQLHFRGRGQLRVTDASVPGRALVLLDALGVRTTPASGPVTVRLSDSQVLNMACFGEAPAPTPCGSPDRRGWHVRLPDTAGVDVVAQVDLAQP